MLLRPLVWLLLLLLTHNTMAIVNVESNADFDTRFQQLRDFVADKIYEIHMLNLRAGVGFFKLVLDSAARVKNKPKGAEHYVKKLTAYMPELENFINSGSRDVKKDLFTSREYFLRFYQHYKELEFDKLTAQLLQKSLLDILEFFFASVSAELDKFVNGMSEEEKRNNKKFLEFYEELKREIYLPKHLYSIETYFELPIYINRHPASSPIKYT